MCWAKMHLCCQNTVQRNNTVYHSLSRSKNWRFLGLITHLVAQSELNHTLGHLVFVRSHFCSFGKGYLFRVHVVLAYYVHIHPFMSALQFQQISIPPQSGSVIQSVSMNLNHDQETNCKYDGEIFQVSLLQACSDFVNFRLNAHFPNFVLPRNKQTENCA